MFASTRYTIFTSRHVRETWPSDRAGGHAERRLRVRGVDILRVADSSAMPFLVAVNHRREVRRPIKEDAQG
jgi:hypothetical protein